MSVPTLRRRPIRPHCHITYTRRFGIRAANSLCVFHVPGTKTIVTESKKERDRLVLRAATAVVTSSGNEKRRKSSSNLNGTRLGNVAVRDAPGKTSERCSVLPKSGFSIPLTQRTVVNQPSDAGSTSIPFEAFCPVLTKPRSVLALLPKLIRRITCKYRAVNRLEGIQYVKIVQRFL